MNVLGTVRYAKGKGFESQYNPQGVLRYNIVVDLDEPLDNGLKQVKVYFNGTHPTYDLMMRGDKVMVIDADRKSPRLVQSDQAPSPDNYQPNKVSNSSARSSNSTKGKARNKYDVVQTEASECLKDLKAVAEVMNACIAYASSIRKNNYADLEVKDQQSLIDYDRALAVTLFIKVTEGKELITSDNEPNSEPVPPVEQAHTESADNEELPY